MMMMKTMLEVIKMIVMRLSWSKVCRKRDSENKSSELMSYFKG